MNIGKFGQWMIRQALGSKRGAAVIALLSGPVGLVLDRALLGGRAQAELLKIEAAATEALGRIKGVLE